MKLEAQGKDGSIYRYNESFWTGKKEVTVNDRQLIKTGKKTYVSDGYENVKQYTLKGIFITGVSVVVNDGEETVVLAKNTWYEWILIFLPLIGVVPAVLGGTIGAFLSAVFCLLASVLNATLLRTSKNIVGKIFACIGISIVMNAAWFLIFIIVIGMLIH